MKRRTLSMIALSLVGALTLSLWVPGVSSADSQSRAYSQTDAKAANVELGDMLEKINPDTFLGHTDIVITEPQFQEIGAKAEEITAGTTDDYGKIVAVKSWLKANIAYGYKDGVSQDAYDAFINKIGICQAYSNLTKAMLSYLEIPCVMVNGGSSAGDHAWNMAYAEDKGWILVDSTWGSIVENPDSDGDHYPYYCDSIQVTEGEYVFTYFYGVAVRNYLGNDTTMDIPATFRSLPITALDDDMTNLAKAGTIESISFPANLKNIYNIDYAFQYYTSLKQFQVDDANPYYTSVDGVLYNSDKTQLLVYPAAKTDISFQVPDTVTSFAECVFKYNANLKHVLISDKVAVPAKGGLFYDKSVTVYAPDGSDAAAYAQQNKLPLKDPDEFPKHIHNLTAVPKKDSTCTVKGNIDYWYCQECDKYFSDAEAKTEISKEKTELPLAQHKTQLQNEKDATCTQEGYTGDLVCTECKTVVEKGKTIAKLPHSTQLVGKKDATCTQEGYTGDLVCTECKTVVEKGEAIEKLPHSTQLVGKKDATCAQEGYTGDLVCTECKTVVEKGEAIAKLPHSTQLVDKKDATCTQEGYTGDLVCTECKTVVEKGKTIPAKGHNYEDGVCTVCGAEDPNYVKPTEPVAPSTEPSTQPTTAPEDTTAPQTTGAPDASQAPGTTAPSTDVPPTGDAASVLLWMSVLVLAGSGVLALLAKRKSN